MINLNRRYNKLKLNLKPKAKFKIRYSSRLFACFPLKCRVVYTRLPLNYLYSAAMIRLCCGSSAAKEFIYNKNYCRGIICCPLLQRNYESNRYDDLSPPFKVTFPPKELRLCKKCRTKLRFVLIISNYFKYRKSDSENRSTI